MWKQVDRSELDRVVRGDDIGRQRRADRISHQRQHEVSYLDPSRNPDQSDDQPKPGHRGQNHAGGLPRRHTNRLVDAQIVDAFAGVEDDRADDGGRDLRAAVGQGQRVADLLSGGLEESAGDDGPARFSEPVPGDQRIVAPGRVAPIFHDHRVPTDP
jgi:hypothetical protein